MTLPLPGLAVAAACLAGCQQQSADGRDDLSVADGDGPRLTHFLSIDPSTDPSTEENP